MVEMTRKSYSPSSQCCAFVRSVGLRGCCDDVYGFIAIPSVDEHLSRELASLELDGNGGQSSRQKSEQDSNDVKTGSSVATRYIVDLGLPVSFEFFLLPMARPESELQRKQGNFGGRSSECSGDRTSESE